MSNQQRFENRDIMDTGQKFFGYRIFLEKPNDEKLAGAIKRLFVKDRTKSGPLEIKDDDSQIILNSIYGKTNEIDKDFTANDQKYGNKSLDTPKE